MWWGALGTRRPLMPEVSRGGEEGAPGKISVLEPVGRRPAGPDPCPRSGRRPPRPEGSPIPKAPPPPSPAKTALVWSLVPPPPPRVSPLPPPFPVLILFPVYPFLNLSHSLLPGPGPSCLCLLRSEERRVGKEC